MLKRLMPVILLFALMAVAMAGGMPDLDAVPRVSLEELKSRLGDPDLVIIDTRRFEDMVPPTKIPGAIVVQYDKVDQWSDRIPKDKEIITYCA
jgi:rhodanese-related sulfurtransferase